MKIIELGKAKNFNPKQFDRRIALIKDADHLISENCHVYCDGKKMLSYLQLADESSKFLNALQRIKYAKSTRTGGYVRNSAVFAYEPRNAIRKDWCSATAMSWEQPDHHAVICDYADIASQIYQSEFPQEFEFHKKEVEKVLPNWKINGTPFTSGIANHNSAIKYHFDTGNFKNTMSVMFGFKRGIAGGYLVLPELRTALEIGDNTVTIFDGQKNLHGVTPITPLKSDAYRYTVVYYSRQQMWKCLPPNEEVARANVRREQIQANRSKI